MHRRLLRLLLIVLALSTAAMAPAARADVITTDGGNGFNVGVHAPADPTAGRQSDESGDDDLHNEAENVGGYEDAVEEDDAVDDPPLAGEAVAKKKAKARKRAKRSRQGARQPRPRPAPRRRSSGARSGADALGDQLAGGQQRLGAAPRPREDERALQGGDHPDDELAGLRCSSPSFANRSVAASIQPSKTSAHASRIGSLVLETSSATVAIGHASCVAALLEVLGGGPEEVAHAGDEVRAPDRRPRGSSSP